VIIAQTDASVRFFGEDEDGYILVKEFGKNSQKSIKTRFKANFIKL
jgi:hypothetical protein